MRIRRDKYGNETGYSISEAEHRRDHIRSNIACFLATSDGKRTLDEICRHVKTDAFSKNITDEEVKKQLNYMIHVGDEKCVTTMTYGADKKGFFWFDEKSLLSSGTEHYIVKVYKDKNNYYEAKKFLEVPIDRQKSNIGSVVTDWKKILGK